MSGDDQVRLSFRSILNGRFRAPRTLASGRSRYFNPLSSGRSTVLSRRPASPMLERRLQRFRRGAHDVVLRLLYLEGLNRSRGRRFGQAGGGSLRCVFCDVVDRGNPPRSSTGAGPWTSRLPPSRRCANACSRTCACASSSPRRSPATCVQYASSPPSSRRSPDTATAEDLRRFQMHLVEQGTSPITLNATITGLKFFFDVTLDRGELMAKMQPVRVPRTLPVVLSREEVARLIAAAAQPQAPDGAVGGLRHRAARQRGHLAQGRRHRQPAHDAARGAGQGPQGPLRHAPADAAGAAACVVACGSCPGQDPAQRLAVPGPGSRWTR